MPKAFNLTKKLTPVLQEVEKPARYLGGEVGAVVKDEAQIRLHVALVFPDAYEMGESHMGLKILYKILNDQPHIWAERVYAPLPDMETALKKHDLPLFSLESRRPLHEFDLVGITLPYELVYTNILTILDRGRVPLWQKDRTQNHPIIIGGGTCAFNPEPIADLFDAIVVGDGEELMPKLAQEILDYKENKKPRTELLKDLTRHEGVYVPSLFEIEYHQDGTVKETKAQLENYLGVTKATVTNLDQAPYPTAPVVPHMKVIHDRIGIEVQRGCVRACRFCQAGYIYRPERQRSPDTVKKIAAESLQNTGQEEVSLLSLSVGDYEPLSPLLNELFDQYEQDRVSISLPATRTETLTPEVIAQIKRVRKTGFTIAPEAGTPRMRRIINKGNAREDVLKAVDNVFKQGWRLIKFYYMCGLPLETEADVIGITEESKLALDIGKQYTKHPRINVSVSSFVPKPFTPFQWEPQLGIDRIKKLHQLLQVNLREPGLTFKHHHVEMSYLEGVFSRGDRRLTQALIRAYELGARFDEWQEHFKFEIWEQAFRETNIDPDFYVTRRRPRHEILPWDHLFVQMKKDFLWKELEAAHDLAFIEDCSMGRCTNCGVCDFRKVKNINYQYLADEEKVQAYSTRRRVLKNEPEQHLKNRNQHVSSVSAANDQPATRNPQPAAQKEFKTRLKLRVKYKKIGESAYLSHLDLMTVLKRAIARAKVPVGFSQGFHPQKLLSMGPAQALGQESLCEFFDIELTDELTCQEFQDRMNASLPPGIQILEVANVATNVASLNGSLEEQVYAIELDDPGYTSQDMVLKIVSPKIEAFNQAKEFKIERLKAKTRRRKIIDIRPMIKALKLIAPNQLRLVTRFSQEHGSVKPSEVMAALWPKPQLAPLHRIRKIDSVFKSAVEVQP